jgi:hypothetical protein
MQLITIPLVNALGKTKGVEFAPSKILETMKREILLSESGIQPKFTLSQAPIDQSNIEQSNEQITQHLSPLAETTQLPIPAFGALQENSPIQA